MGELQQKAMGKEPVVQNGKLKTTFKRVVGCKKLDRMVARNNMLAAGYTQLNKKINGTSKFAENWKNFVY